MFVHARLVLSVLLFVMCPASAHAEERHWQRVMSAGIKVGSIERTRRVDGDQVHTLERFTMELGKAGRRVTYTVTLDTESSADGALVRMMRDARTREGHSRVEARVLGADLEIEIGAGAHRQSRLLPGAGAGLKAEEFSRAWRQAAGRGEPVEPLQFRTFDAAKADVVDLELSPVPPADGPARIQRTVRYGKAVNARRQTLNPDGEVIEETLRLGGVELTLAAASEAEARSPNQPLDHVVGQFQQSPYRFPAKGRRAKIRYGFDNGGRAPPIPIGGGQRSWTDGQTTWIQVCAECALDEATLSDAARARSLAPTPWLNFDDAAITTPARRMSRADDPALTMRRLTRYVRTHMSVEHIDMLGYGSALEAFRSRRGDCTEYAVLLAAFGRAAGIPTRVVSGLVYAREFEGQSYVFVPHAWVHAWTGTGWESFDAALGSFDSTHLAMVTSDDGNPSELFAGMNLAHELRLTRAARVMPRKPPPE